MIGSTWELYNPLQSTSRLVDVFLACAELYSKVQRRPTDDDDFDVTGESSRTKIIIPKRGEKDFEPMQETVNLQEMMLQRSREALFGALAGVRGGSRYVVPTKLFAR